MVYGFYLRMALEKIDDGQRVGYVTFYPKRQGLQPLQEHERVEGRDRRSGISQQYSPDPGDEGRAAGCFGEPDAMIAWVGF